MTIDMTDTTDKPSIPGNGWFAVAGVVAVGTVVAVVALVAWFVLTLDQGAQFIGPGRHTATLDKPGTYLVWNDYRTVFNGRTYDESEKLPSGVRVSVLDAESGQALTVSPSVNTRSDMGDTARKSVAQFEITRPGRYEIIIGGDFPARVFSVSQTFLLALFGVIFGAFALLFVGFSLAIGVVCWVLIKRSQVSEAAARAPANALLARAPSAMVAADATEKSRKDLTRIIYVLQLCSLASGITLIVAVTLNYAKRGEVAGTWLESHFIWQIRTFWYCLLWTCIGIATAIIIIGFFVLMGMVVWMIYRAVKGLSHLEENKPMVN